MRNERFRILNSELTVFLVFSENDNHPILSSGSEKDKQLVSPSQSRPVPAIFSAATSWLTMSSKIPIPFPFEFCSSSLISIPLILASVRQGLALLLILWRIVASRRLNLLYTGPLNDLTPQSCCTPPPRPSS